MVSKSYVLRTRMHFTSQKSIACGSYFWGVMDSFARLNLSNVVSAYIANRKKRNFVGGNVALTLLLFSLPHRSKM